MSLYTPCPCTSETRKPETGEVVVGGLTDQREAADNPDRKKKKNKYAQRLKGVLIEAFVMFEKVRSPGEGGGREGGKRWAYSYSQTFVKNGIF